ncbi:hypothetical protein E2562_035905 [Oryza meyeriana var. granulata]|uniref:PPIase cyclophilin-type domain-containing protein n=1 Tax=Oryza meyeriana var. granulata TaxID=110450 RepID=A0A6G1E759_9ORYZ|nr:hypothetical protein E2562_035905 [Oryza meyeriana var. granulata]
MSPAQHSGGTPETRNGLLEVQKAFRDAGLEFSKQVGWKHVVFGKVLSGMDVVYKIEAEGTQTGAPQCKQWHAVETIELGRPRRSTGDTSAMAGEFDNDGD